MASVTCVVERMGLGGRKQKKLGGRNKHPGSGWIVLEACGKNRAGGRKKRTIAADGKNWAGERERKETTPQQRMGRARRGG